MSMPKTSVRSGTMTIPPPSPVSAPRTPAAKAPPAMISVNVSTLTGSRALVEPMSVGRGAAEGVRMLAEPGHHQQDLVDRLERQRARRRGRHRGDVRDDCPERLVLDRRRGVGICCANN